MDKITPQVKEQAARQHMDMVLSVLEHQVKTFFPGDEIEFKGQTWTLTHHSETAGKVLDLSISLADNGSRIIGFEVARSFQGRGKSIATIECSREALEEAIRRCLFSG